MISLKSQTTVLEELQNFWLVHNYGHEGGVNRKYVWIKFGFFSLPILNMADRRENVYLHDINHILTSYDTSWKGEAEISAWEIASGGWKNIYVIWFFALWSMGLGLLFYPRDTLKAFRRGLTMRNALTCNLAKQELYALTTVELKRIVNNKPKHNTNILPWIAISLLVFILPLIVGILSSLLILKTFISALSFL